MRSFFCCSATALFFCLNNLNIVVQVSRLARIYVYATKMMAFLKSGVCFLFQPFVHFPEVQHLKSVVALHLPLPHLILLEWIVGLQAFGYRSSVENCRRGLMLHYAVLFANYLFYLSLLNVLRRIKK